MAAGSVTVDLLARTGSFVTDIDRATKQAEKRMADFKKAVAASFTGNLLAGFASQAVAEITALPGKVLAGIDALNDVADATGSSIEKISALEDTALRTGTSMDTVTAGIIRFNQGLAGVDEDGKAAKAFEALGLHIEDLRKMDPADAMLKTAQALDQFADDQNKAAIIQALFGKSTREVAAFMHDLGDQTQLTGTVTTAQAKEVEKFNQGIAALGKNVLDVARYLSQDFVTSINNAVDAWRRSGLSEAVFTFFTGTDKFKLQKEMVGLTDDLLRQQAELDRLNSGRAQAQQVETQTAIVRGIQQRIDKTRQLLQLQEPTAFSGQTTAVKPSAPRVDTSKAPKVPKGPKDTSDNDFKQYLENLQKQTEKLRELNTLETLHAEIARGALSVTPKQREQLELLAQTIDKEKAHKKSIEEKRAVLLATNDAYTAGIEAYRQRLDTLLSGTPGQELERMRSDIKFLNEALEAGPERGGITQQQHLEAMEKALGIVSEKATETRTVMDELGVTFSSAFENAVLGGGKVQDVFKGLFDDVARVILRLGVLEPLMKSLKTAMSGDAGGGGGSWWESLLKMGGSLLGGLLGGGSGAAGAAFVGGTSGLSYGGMAASGANVFPGSAYLVGEGGKREVFVPTSSGRVVPVDDTARERGGGETGGTGWTLINQGTPSEVAGLDPRERVLILRDARRMVAADMHDANSDIARSLQRNTTANRRRT